jgi:sterol 24-C-methyltransferase
VTTPGLPSSPLFRGQTVPQEAYKFKRPLLSLGFSKQLRILAHSVVQTLSDMESPYAPAPRDPGLSSETETSSVETLVHEKHRLRLHFHRTQHAQHHKPDWHNSAATKRGKTFWTSVRYLHGLSEKQVDEFMASYVIYNLDWSDEKQMIAALGENYQERVRDCLKAYYGVINHLCALGDVEKMYIPPLISKKATVLENQLLYEESIARDIGLKPGDKVLDLGCGRGRVAAHMAQFSGATVVGLNVDPNQVAQARQFNEERGFQNTFVVQDFNDLPLPFADQTFDAFYQIQALSLCKDLPALFSEIYRVLKPGARISLLDWASLPAYDPTNPEHAELMRRVKPLIGAVGTPTPKSLEKALMGSGFDVLRSDNASLDGLQAPLIETVDIYFRTMRHIILGLVKVRILPGHFKTLINRLCLDGEAFVKMDTQRLATTSYRIIAQKP